MTSGRARYVDAPLPRDVPGFAAARRAGLLPPVPAEPPRTAVQPTSGAAIRTAFATVGGFVLAVVLTVVLLAREGEMTWTAIGASLLVAAVGWLVSVRAFRRYGRAQLAELALGYTTTTYEIGRWWMRTAPDGPITTGNIGWDWRGTWVLRRDGSVVSPPTVRQEPPGLYPSPRQDGSWELWTGRQWTNLLVPREDVA